MLQGLVGEDRKAQDARDTILRKLWLCDGFLEHNLCLDRLSKLIDVYDRIKVVPKGYD